ncbi:MAG: hypothetical protein KDI82_12820 [Gammaproteobacteria bacterium]|nr:hypothetical protein [Gammaproteobacteria bacterium]
MPRATLRSFLPYLIVTALMLTAVTGCGFQPRGSTAGLNSVPSPLYISGIGRYSALHRAIERELVRSGGSLAQSAADSSVVLHVIRHESDARVLSVDGRNKAVENELEELARIEVRRGATLVAEPQTVRVLRIQFRPSSEILASERESEQVRDDMRRELAQRILQRVAAQH